MEPHFLVSLVKEREQYEFPFVCTGNIASIFLLTRKELSSFFNQLLAVLCTCDMIYLVTMMLEAIRNLGFETSVHMIIFSYLLYPLNAFAMMGSIYMTIVIGFERYFMYNLL